MEILMTKEAIAIFLIAMPILGGIVERIVGTTGIQVAIYKGGVATYEVVREVSDDLIEVITPKGKEVVFKAAFDIKLK